MVTHSDGKPQQGPGQAEWQKAGELTRDVRSLHEAYGEPDGSRKPLRRKRSRPRCIAPPPAGTLQPAEVDTVVTRFTYCDPRAERYRWVQGVSSPSAGRRPALRCPLGQDATP